jgi:IPT/TIG domain/PASTA domain
MHALSPLTPAPAHERVDQIEAPKRLGVLVRRSRLVPLVAAMACASALAAASTASAALITLGPPLSTTTYTPTNCTNPGCTFSHFALPGGSLPASPVDGAIVSWSLKGASATPGYAIRILSRSGTSLTGIATSTPQTPAGSGLQTFATALPVKQGQLIGVDIPQGGTFGLVELTGATLAEVTPLLLDGATKPVTEFPNDEVGFSAQVQPAPTISVLGSTSGPATGGSSVLVAGTDFEGATSVKFGATPATFSVTSENTITATSPPAAAGPVPVTVTTVAGTASSAQQFVYTTPPPPPAPTCKVPKLKGKTLKSAKKRIRAADCRVGKLTKKEGATAKDGKVVKQAPKPGVTVPANTKVKMTLAP